MIDTLQVSANNIFITCAKVLDAAAYDTDSACLTLPNNLFLHDTATQLDRDIIQYNEVLDNFLTQFNDASYVVRKIKEKLVNEGKSKPLEPEISKDQPIPDENPTPTTYEPSELDFGDFLESADKSMGYEGMDMDMDFDDNYSSIYGQEKVDTETRTNEGPSANNSDAANKRDSLVLEQKGQNTATTYNGNTADHAQSELDEFNFNDLMGSGEIREQTPQNADFDVDALQGDGEMDLFGELNELESILGNR